MSRQIIFHGEYFLDFYKNLDVKVKMKIQYVFEEMGSVPISVEMGPDPISDNDWI